jgi:hypothetical protein
MNRLPVTLAFVLTVLPGLLLWDQPAPAAMTQAESDAVIDAQCRPIFHAACSQGHAMARWVDGFKLIPQSNDEARLDRLDAFAYGGRRTLPSDDRTFFNRLEAFVNSGRRALPNPFTASGPDDGTAFAYGGAAPNSGHAVYDPVHRIAFFAQGAFDFGQVQLVAAAGPPPKAVVRRNLANVRTVRGAYLGETSAAVRATYGANAPTPAWHRPGLSVLAYGMKFSVSAQAQCAQGENFLLRNDRVIAIEISNVC